MVEHVCNKPTLFDKAISLYKSLGCNDQEAYEYACNDVDHWTGYKDNFSINFIRF